VARGRLVAQGAACLSLLLLQGAAGAREKTDVLTLKNGDRITGEVVALEYGKLKFKTADIGTLSVEWRAVAGLRSDYTFDVESVAGAHYYGKLSPAADGRNIEVGAAAQRTELGLQQVARIAQIEKRWLERINGSLSFGYNFTKSSDISILTGHFDASYRAPRVVMGLRADATSTTSPEEGTLARDSIAFSYQWLRPQRKFWLGLTSFERNEELGIEGRVQLGGGFGYYVRQRASSEVAVILGSVANQEWITGTAGTRTSVEGLVGASWRVFQFKSPETSLTSSAFLFPSFTEAHRYRAAVNLSLRREIVSDFFIDLSTYYDYDSQPPDPSSAQEDYGIVTSLGYSF
jgi:hypothetical protein